MRRSNGCKVVVLGVLAAFLLSLIMPTMAAARYRSHYDDLPGNDSPPWGTIAIVGITGGIAVALLAMAISHNKKDKEQEATPNDDSDSDATEDSGSKESSEPPDKETEEISMSAFQKNSSKLNLYFDVGQTPQTGLDKSRLDFDATEVRVGVAINF